MYIKKKNKPKKLRIRFSPKTEGSFYNKLYPTSTYYGHLEYATFNKRTDK